MVDSKKKNMFLERSKTFQAVVILMVVGVCFSLLEVAGFGVFYYYYRVLGNATLPRDEIFLNSFHPFFHKIDFSPFPVTSEFDTSFLYRSLPNLPFGDCGCERATDRHGFAINREDQKNRDLLKEKKKFRIFLLGGSTVMGNSGKKDLGSYIQVALERTRPGKFLVINAGASGYNSTQELNQFMAKIIYFSPDMIVTFDGINDVGTQMYSKDFERNEHIRGKELRDVIKQYHYSSWNDAITVNRFALLNWIRQFYSVEIAFKIMRRLGRVEDFHQRDKILSDRYYNFDLPPEYRAEALDTYIENLRSLSMVATDRKIFSLHLLQPTLAVEIDARDFGVHDKIWAVFNTPNYLAAEHSQTRAKVLSKFFRQAAHRFNDLNKKSGALEAWADLSGLFRDEKDLTTIYFDYTHFLDGPHETIAAAVAARILGLVEREN